MTVESIVAWGQAILAFGLAFGVLVFVHEFGHYAVAKACGVTVEVFSFGFGRRLFGFHRRGTDYRVSLVPLGGYVKMLGENPDEALSGDPGEFGSKPKWQRFLILVAGAAMNIVLAIVCYTVVFTQGDERPIYLDEPPVVGGFEDGTPAQKAGVLPGDEILRVNGRAVATWEELKLSELLSPDKPVTLAIRRDGKLLDIVVQAGSERDPVTKSKLGTMGIEPRGSIVARTVEPGSPAGKAGMRSGDRIVSVDGVAIQDILTLIRTIRGSGGRTLRFVLERAGQRLELDIAAVDRGEGFRTGFSPVYESRRIEFTLAQAFQRALQETGKQSGFLLRTLKALLTRETGLPTVSGPIGIFQVTATAAASGWDYYVQVMALISLNLGIINLLPIPVLDGGHIFILAIEGIMRRDLSFKLKERLIHVGLVFLMALMVVVMFNDVRKNVPALDKIIPWGGP